MPATFDPLNHICDIAEAASILGLTPEAVRKRCQVGTIAAKRIGRDWVLDRDAVVESSKEGRAKKTA